MATQSQLQPTTPRERFTQLIILASSEIALLAAVMLLFFIYSYGQNIYLAIFSLLILLAGSIIIRQSIQAAQIILMLSVATVELIFLLNFKLGELPYGLPADLLPISFLLFDIFLVVFIVRNGALPSDRS